MTMEECEKGKLYRVEWVDGAYKTNCIFEKRHKGFFIFIDENNMKVICRPSSIKKLTLLKS